MNILLFVLLILIACSSKKSEQPKYNSETQSTQNITRVADKGVQNVPEPENTFIDKSLFKFQKLESFSLENWYYGARQESLIKMTNEQIKKYFQNSELKNNLENKYNDYYFFSIQKSYPGTTITLIEEYSSCCTDLLLMNYDLNNKLISKEKVAGIGGDGSWGYYEFGKFSSDTGFQLTRIEEESIRDDQDTMEYRIDSIIVKYNVNNDLIFTKEHEEAFQRNKLIVN